MKSIPVYFLFVLTLLTACNNDDDKGTPIENDNSIAKLLPSYDLWYVDNIEQSPIYVDFAKDAITLSFKDGQVFAHNNLVGFNAENDGALIANYSVEQEGKSATVYIDDKAYTVIGIGGNALKLVDSYDTTNSFYITGYQTDEFPLADAYYFRMAHLFTEYKMWEKTDEENPDDLLSTFTPVNYLKFRPTRSFFSSTDNSGLSHDDIEWNTNGSYNLTHIKDEETIDKPRHNQLIIIPFSEEGNNELDIEKSDTLEVYFVDDASLKIIDKKGIEYTYKGSENTPF